jgi:cation transport regulator ChaC
LFYKGGIQVIYYFAYGSCMDEQSFAQTVGKDHYEVAGAAVLKDYQLVFSAFSKKRNGGVADLVFAPGEEVEGVLYRITPEALEPLDEREGVPSGKYKRMDVHVCFQEQLVRAMTYTIVNKEQEEIKPSKEYLQLIYNGASRFLSDAYRTRLAGEWSSKFGISDFLQET